MKELYILFFDIIANADRWVESRMFEKEHEDFKQNRKTNLQIASCIMIYKRYK